MIDTYRELEQGFYNAGLEPPHDIDIDGKLHRYAQPDKPKSNSSWYVFFDAAHGIAGTVGDWRTGVSHNISTWRNNKLSQADIDVTKASIAQSRDRAEKARQVDQESTAMQAQLVWSNANPAVAAHPYLTRKRIAPFGLREAAGSLIVPVADIDDTLWSIQRISSKGEKRFLSGGRTKACMCWVEGKRNDTLYVAEGWATAASVTSYTGRTTACAFNAGNLPSVAMAIHKKYPHTPLIVVADNDDAGLKAAKKAANATGADIWCPPTPGYDFNDWYVESGVLV